jgi:hypothetical protein
MSTGGLWPGRRSCAAGRGRTTPAAVRGGNTAHRDFAVRPRTARVPTRSLLNSIERPTLTGEGADGLASHWSRRSPTQLSARRSTCRLLDRKPHQRSGPAPQDNLARRGPSLDHAAGPRSAGMLLTVWALHQSPGTRARHQAQSVRGLLGGPGFDGAGQGAKEESTAAATWSLVVGNTGTGLSSGPTRSSISVQPRMTPSAPAATSRPTTSR